MEEELRRCIFCTIPKPIAAFNKEHIFPEAIGGRIVIFHVCTECNGRLGNQTDHHLTDNFLIQLFRNQNRIGGTPNPFPEGRSLDDPKQIVYTDIRDGVLVPKLRVQKIDTNELGIIQFTGDEKDYTAIKAAVDKTLRRNNLPSLTDEEFRERLSETPISGMTVDASLDTFNIARALAKIAYEMTWRWLGDSYIDDDLAQEIRQFIRHGERNQEYPFIRTCRLVNEDEIAKLNNTDHSAILTMSDHVISCMVTISNIFVGVFVMSNTRVAYSPEFTIAAITNNAVSGSIAEDRI